MDGNHGDFYLDSFGPMGDESFVIPRMDSNEIFYGARRYKLFGGKYVRGDKLGEGSYGVVKECINIHTLQRCAVKIIKRQQIRRIPNGEQNVQREIKVLRKLKHKHVIGLLEVLHNQEKGKIYMIMDYCVTDLNKLLQRAPEKKLPDWQSHKYFVQLVDGLEYLHSCGVIHKDIKPGNLLLTTDSTLKICDFGVAEQINLMEQGDVITTSQGTQIFQPPEVAAGETFYSGCKIDVWSAGCTLYNLATGKLPYEGENLYRICDNICNEPVIIPSDLENKLRDLLEGMLTKDPANRYNLEDVKKHIWCKQNIPETSGEPGISLGGDDPRQSTTIIPYLQAHYCMSDSQSQEQYFTEHQLNESRNQAYCDSEVSNETNGRRSKPTSCISVRNMSSTCSQS